MNTIRGASSGCVASWDAFRFLLIGGLFLAGICARASAQESDVTIIRTRGEPVRGELLVATDVSIIVRTNSDVHNIWWQGDSAFAVLLLLGQVQRVVVEGKTVTWLGGGIGCAAGAGLGAFVTRDRPEAGAFGLGLIGGLTGALVGALMSHGEVRIDQSTPGGFSILPQYARFGMTTPPMLKDVK